MKKLLAVLLVLLMAFNLAACSSKPVEQTVAPAGEASNAQETVTIKMVMKDVSPTDPIMTKYFGKVEEALAADGKNIKIELVEMPAGNYSEKLNLMLLGGEIPDLIYFQGGDEQMAEQGLLEDLRPYVEESEYLKDILYPHNVERLENYPYLLWVKPVGSKVPVVRTDWFDTMETASALQADPSVDNYYNFLKEMKEKDLTSGGPKYGITVAGNLFEINQVFNQAFGLTSTWLNNGGTYEYSKVSENEKQRLAFYADLYKEGIFDKEYLTKKWDTKEQAFYDNEVGVIIGTSGKVVDIYDGKMIKTNGDAAKLTVLPPAKGQGQGYMPVDTTKESRGFAISAVSEHKKEVFEILDFMASPAGQKLDRLGFEGEHYNVVDGKIEVTPKAQEWYAIFWEPAVIPFEADLATPLLGDAARASLEMADEYYTADINFKVPADMTPNWDAMENLYKEYSADIITGKKSIDAFDEFVTKWYEAGGEDVTAYANEVLK